MKLIGAFVSGSVFGVFLVIWCLDHGLVVDHIDLRNWVMIYKNRFGIKGDLW